MVERVRRGIVEPTDPVRTTLESAWRAGAGDERQRLIDWLAERGDKLDKSEEPLDVVRANEVFRCAAHIRALPLPPYPGGEGER